MVEVVLMTTVEEVEASGTGTVLCTLGGTEVVVLKAGIVLWTQGGKGTVAPEAGTVVCALEGTEVVAPGVFVSVTGQTVVVMGIVCVITVCEPA